MRRRDFVKGIAVSSAWPLAAQAQQRRVTDVANIAKLPELLRK
jgi:hypothetical protein